MAIIRRSLVTDGTFSPLAANFLEQIPDDALFYVAQGLRHPDAIYRLSLDKVADAFCKVAEEYQLKTQEYRNGNSTLLQIDQLLIDQGNLLHAFQEHVDELWMILKTLVDPSSAAKHPTFNDKYVIDNKLPGAKSFQDAIADYKKLLRIANKLKHQQCYLRGVAVWFQGGVHLGYCLEEPDNQGIIGPSQEIHPDQGAFSFARDITWHLAHVYLCSEKLVAAVKKVLNTRGISIQSKACASDKKWEKVISLASQIPSAYFPKEVKKPLARFYLDDDSQLLTIKISEHLRLSFPHPLKAGYSFAGDGYSKKFKLPLP
jgi:hypothetical protein